MAQNKFVAYLHHLLSWYGSSYESPFPAVKEKRFENCVYIYISTVPNIGMGMVTWSWGKKVKFMPLLLCTVTSVSPIVNVFASESVGAETPNWLCVCETCTCHIWNEFSSIVFWLRS